MLIILVLTNPCAGLASSVLHVWIINILIIFYRAFELWNQLRKKSELYQSDVVLMPHGDDFRYNIEREWEEQLANLDKLIKFINGREEMQMKVCCLKDFHKKFG